MDLWCVPLWALYFNAFTEAVKRATTYAPFPSIYTCFDYDHCLDNALLLSCKKAKDIFNY
jgi:hypothetical protein